MVGEGKWRNRRRSEYGGWTRSGTVRRREELQRRRAVVNLRSLKGTARDPTAKPHSPELEISSY